MVLRHLGRIRRSTLPCCGLVCLNLEVRHYRRRSIGRLPLGNAGRQNSAPMAERIARLRTTRLNRPARPLGSRPGV